MRYGFRSTINRSAAKYLFNQGHTAKEISIILGCLINSVRYCLHDDTIIPLDIGLTDKQQTIRYCIVKIKQCNGIATAGFCDYDKIYIQILHFLSIPMERLYKLYYNVEFRKIKHAFYERKLRWVDLPAQLLGLTDEEYLTFLRAVKKFSVDNKVRVTR